MSDEHPPGKKLSFTCYQWNPNTNGIANMLIKVSIRVTLHPLDSRSSPAEDCFSLMFVEQCFRGGPLVGAVRRLWK